MENGKMTRMAAMDERIKSIEENLAESSENTNKAAQQLKEQVWIKKTYKNLAEQNP